MELEHGWQGPGDLPRWVLVDRAVARLQEVLESLPQRRALPDLDELLAAAGADRRLLEDERARKLLQEAIRQRPLSSLEEVRVLRTEVELLTVEVAVLQERLTDTSTEVAERRELLARLRRVRRRCQDLAAQL
ncbi:MAG: hypothetical protein R6U94_06725 [Nitriliruptoraceae bacterium]